MDKYQALLAIAFAWIFLLSFSCDAAAAKERDIKFFNTTQSDFSSSRGTSLYDTLPCSYRRNIYFHGASWEDGKCLTCTCSNSTVVCSLQNCPIIACSDGQEPVTRENECCESCPDPSTTIDLSDDDSKSCKYGFNNSYWSLPVGESRLVHPCMTCICQAARDLKCDIRSCENTFCKTPLTFDGECCGICPYHLPVLQVTPSEVPAISAGKLNNVVFNLIILAIGGLPIRGNGLLKVSAWAADSDGNRVGFTDQVLSTKQADEDIRRPPITNSFNYTIDGIEFTLDAWDKTCSEMEYLCVELARGDNPTMKDPRLPFTLEGIVSEDNKTILPSNLLGCTAFPACREPGQRTQISFSVAKKSGQITSRPISILSWSEEFNNVGGAFDSETGVFTSPETGSYFFTYKMAETSHMLSPKVRLMKNDDAVLVGRSNCNGIILDLQLGDIVWLQIQGELVGSSEIYSTFSGFLVN